ncbi:hypothetical protein [Enterobacter hormaechei]|uniref:hypothetical protein n=1 Tax=Enterobacter hormaechei TaxID=158836 RepID=UPI0033161DC5
MSTTLKDWLKQTIAELEEERDAMPGAVNEDAAMALAAMKLALAMLEAEPAISINIKDGWPEPNSATPVVGVERLSDGVHELYTAPPAPTVPDKITSANAPEVFEIAAEAERLGLRGAYASYAVGWNACRAAMLQGADGNIGKPLTIKLPDISSKAFWSGTGKNETFHPETYRRWVKEAIEISCTIARVDVEVK